MSIFSASLRGKELLTPRICAASLSTRSNSLLNQVWYRVFVMLTCHHLRIDNYTRLSRYSMKAIRLRHDSSAAARNEGCFLLSIVRDWKSKEMFISKHKHSIEED